MSANGPHAEILPLDRFTAYRPQTDITSAAWVHFFGKYRFVDPTYLKFARESVNGSSQLTGKS